jgi:lysine-specific demethylase 8
LLDQVRSLRKDVIIPDYCALVDSKEPELLNCFIGPCTSISPLHTDPRHNFFCQIRGQKFVRLIDPKFSDQIYLYDNFLQANSSQIDVESPDYDAFPLFKNVICEDFIMEEGDCLFIPKQYLHYVRALKPSISLSVWFG